MTDNLDFDQILNICLDRLQAGETVADCLTSYPQHAPQLAPLLQVAGLLQTPPGPAMSVEGLRAGEARLLAHAATLRARRKGRTFPLAGITRRLAAASVASALLVCVMLTVGTLSAAAASLPGSPLYPVKQASESVVSWAAFTPQLKTTVHLAWADRRLREAEALMARDGMPDASVLAALEQETEQALAAAEQAGPDQLTAVAAQTEHQQTVLGAVLARAPAAARPGLERALAASANGHARAQSALDKAKPGKPDKEHPHGTPPGQAGKEGSQSTPPGQPTEEPPRGTPPGQAGKDQPQGTPPSQPTETLPGNTPPGQAGKDRPQSTPPGQPTEEPPRGTPPGQAGKDRPQSTPPGQPTDKPPRGTPPGQAKDQLTPTEEEQLTATPLPGVTISPEPTPSVETPTPNTSQDEKEKKDKEDKEKKDKKK